MELSDPGLLADPVVADALREELSVLAEPAPLVVRPVGGVVLPSAAGPVLRELPTVTVLVAQPEQVTPDVAGAFDVCLARPGRDAPAPFVPAPLDDVLDAVRTQPLAATALAALLRDPRPSTWAGLAAESAVYALLLGSAGFGAWLAGRGERPPAPSPHPVAVSRRDATATLTLDRPEVHNALDTAMRDALVEALRVVAGDPSVARIELRGSGPSFCSGGDLAEFGTVGDPATAHAVRLTRHPAYWVDRCAPRTIAYLHGACIGAGIELPAFAGEVVAAPDAFFALPELGLGLVPGAGGTVSLPRRIGRARTAWLALTGARIDAPTALRWGLVDRIEP